MTLIYYHYHTPPNSHKNISKTFYFLISFLFLRQSDVMMMHRVGFGVKICRAISYNGAELSAEWIGAWRSAGVVLTDPGCILSAQKCRLGCAVWYVWGQAKAVWFETVSSTLQSHNFLVCKEELNRKLYQSFWKVKLLKYMWK